VNPFRQRIRQSIPTKPCKLHWITTPKRRVQGRITAFASLPDWQARRQSATPSAPRSCGHLDEYLAQFTAKVEENGIIVHRATRMPPKL